MQHKRKHAVLTHIEGIQHQSVSVFIEHDTLYGVKIAIKTNFWICYATAIINL